MPEVPFFGIEDSRRIVNNVRWGEDIKGRGVQLTDNIRMEFPETIYVILQTQDPEGLTGWYKAEERVFDDKLWTAPENPRLWDNTPDNFEYVRHYAWETLPLNTIVEIMPTVNVDTGLEEWVFKNDASNPEAFVFKGSLTANSAGGPQSEWSASGGSVLTNIGELDVLGPLIMGASSYAGVEVVFIDDGNGFRLASATFTNTRTQYWTKGGGGGGAGGGSSASNAPGTITVNHPLATTTTSGTITRLEQHHAGDIHLEVYAFSSDDDEDDVDPYTRPMQILGDEDWIHVTKLGNTWNISHILPAPPKPENSMKGLNKNFSCDPVTFSNVQDAEDWANSVIDNIKHMFWDTKGHVYKIQDCDGANVEEYDEEDDEVLTATLTGNIVGSSLMPNVVLNSSGLDYVYKLLNRGRNFPNWIGQENIMFSITNDLGQTIKFQKGNTAAGIGAVVGFHVLLAENVDGTSGQQYNAASGAADDAVLLSPIRFRFNSSVTIRMGVVNANYAKTLDLATAANEAIINADSTTVRDSNDPLATGFNFTVTYQVDEVDLVNAYKVRYKFTYANGDDVKFSVTGSGYGPFTTGFRDMTFDATFGAFQLDAEIFFELDEGQPNGTVVKLCVELVTDPSIAGNDGLTYNANVDKCIDLSISSDTNCITDESGEQVTDESGECITGIAGFCWSDPFDGVSLNLERWTNTSVATFTSSVSGGSFNVSATSTTGFVLLTQAHSLTGDFNISLDLASFNVGSSGGHDISISVLIGGTNYQLDFRKNNSQPTRGFYKIVGGVFTLLQADASTSKTNQILKIERDASNNLDFILNGSSINTIAGVTGTVTEIGVQTANHGAGATGVVTSVAREFIFEAPIGTPYCT